MKIRQEIKKRVTLRNARNEYGKAIRKEYEAGRFKARRGDITSLTPRKDGISNTITTVQKDNLILEVYGVKTEEGEMEKYRVRNLTARENWRLMGFSDDDYNAAAGTNCSTWLYAQAGNAIVLDVLVAIFRQMLPQEEERRANNE